MAERGVKSRPEAEEILKLIAHEPLSAPTGNAIYQLIDHFLEMHQQRSGLYNGKGYCVQYVEGQWRGKVTICAESRLIVTYSHIRYPNNSAGSQMPIKLKCGAIFLHIPKTGGTFVERVLHDLEIVDCAYGQKHADFLRAIYPTDYRSRLKHVIKEFPRRVVNQFKPAPKHDWTTGPRPDQPTKEDFPFTFCFVRNPVSWIESYYSFVSGQKWYWWSTEYAYLDFWHPNAMLNGLKSESLNEFVGKVLEKRPGYVTEMFGWFVQPATSFVGKNENLIEDLITVLDKRGYDFDPEFIRQYPRQRVSQRQNLDLSWDEGLKKEFINVEYAGFKRFGYDAGLAI